MSAEDRLRDLLQHEAAAVEPVGDGLARIRERIARRRRVRRVAWPTAALATAALVAGLLVVLPHDDPRGPRVLVPATTAPTTPAATPTPTVTPTPSPTPDVGLLPGSYAGPAVWPFTSAEQARSWQGGDWVTDSRQVVARFVTDYLGLSGVTVTQTCVSCEVLGLQVAGRSVGEARVGHYTFTGGKRVFTVVGVGGTDLTVTSPRPGQSVSSPLQVSGRITGVDENVALTLRTAPGGRVVAQGGAPAGSAVPWSATLTWSGSTSGAGALSGVTRSAKDGSVNRVVVVPVTLVQPSSQATFVGVVDGHVSLFDSRTGTLVRQLTFPPSGRVDGDAAWSRDTVVWTRTTPTLGPACRSELDRRGPEGTTTVATSSTAVLGDPQLSASRGWLAWVERPCDGSTPTLVVSGGGAPNRRIAGPSGSTLQVLDVRDDGALLVLTNDRAATGPGAIGLVRPGALKLDGLTPLAAQSGCYLASGAAFDGILPVAYETCGSKARLVRFSSTGARISAGPLTLTTPTSVSASDRGVLVELPGRILLVSGGRTTTVLEQPGCAGHPTARGCVSAPSW